jgi:hypothetical protein
MTAREATYLAVMLALGLRVARDIIGMYRWTPSVFLHGLVVVRDTVQVGHVPQAIPTPPLTTGTFYKAAYRSLGPHQVLFTAQTFNAPCLLGVLEIPQGSSALVMTARLHWSVYALFFVGFTLAGFPKLVLGAMVAMFLLDQRGSQWASGGTSG